MPINEDNPVPVLDFKLFSPSNRVSSQFELFDTLRNQYSSFLSNDARGFWVLTQYENIAAALREHETFSSDSVYIAEPNLRRRWIPVMTNPPEHTAWRRLLTPLFSPRAIAGLKDRITSQCVALITQLAPAGSCDFVAEFARKFPTTIFLELMGLPVEDLDKFLEWEAIIERPSVDSSDQNEVTRQAMTELALYLWAVMKERDNDHRDDVISIALGWEIDGKKVSREDLLALFMQLFVAGLTTVPSELAYMFWHLATNSQDRAHIIASPDSIPAAVEEFLRLYPVALIGRKLARDSNLGGCPMKAGDMVMLPLSSANRDSTVFPEATRFSLGRDRISNHLSFGLGIHNCLGSHLARQELRTALEQWHKLIPEYKIDSAAQIEEYRSQTFWIESLPLTWPAG